jgi:signal transduction histidine kinase
LNELTAVTVSAMQPLALARGLTLAHETDEGRLEITANRTAIRQILLNLLSNATKFTSAGGEVHAGTGYLPDGSIYLVVRDTGEGMDEDILARSFYDESDGIKRRPGGGYGLGLPMVRRLAEANRGQIEIDSAPGKGTVVLISFPTRR